MNRFFTFVFVALMATSMNAESVITRIRLWKDGMTAYREDVAKIDSITFEHEYIPDAPEGATNGWFTINSNGDKVFFSKGNLQYNATTGGFSFAEHQWDTIGTNNRLNGTMDLFSWGTGRTPNSSTASTTFYDWGANPISNGGNQANQWRTLTAAEWYYLFMNRSTNLFGLGTVNGVKGLILLPDQWNGTGFNPGIKSFYNSNQYIGAKWTDNTYTAVQWAEMEAQGAVFLPVTGQRNGHSVTSTESFGGGVYWTSSATGGNTAGMVYFTESDIRPSGQWHSYYGYAVRLVQSIAK